MASSDETQPPENAPILSTPDTRIFEDSADLANISNSPTKSEEQLYLTYEIQKTVSEIRQARWKRIALQFHDHMLPDAPWVAHALSRRLHDASPPTGNNSRTQSDRAPDHSESANEDAKEHVFILADTSYGACCVDEVAAEHGNADVVVHYGRACLSPTARLPVIYCFTKPPLDTAPVIDAFRQLYKDETQKIVLMADVPYQDYLSDISAQLLTSGYTSIFVTDVIRDASSPLPNRSLPASVVSKETELTEWALFHLSEPSPSLLLNISASVRSIHFYPTDAPATTPFAIEAHTTRTLRRRYAQTTRLSTAPVLGILINTLSVRSYMAILAHVRARIARAGKKSYTFAVGRVNAAKVANFADVAGWVVVGCWESSLFDAADFWRPLITPFELEIALTPDDERVWSGRWTSDFEALLRSPARAETETDDRARDAVADPDGGPTTAVEQDASDDESAPPEFDLRTGRYVSHSRPMGQPCPTQTSGTSKSSTTTTVARRPKGDLAAIGGTHSPAADFFRERRTWTGLGSDHVAEYDASGARVPVVGAAVEAGRSGIARGYTVGDGAAGEKH